VVLRLGKFFFYHQTDEAPASSPEIPDAMDLQDEDIGSSLCRRAFAIEGTNKYDHACGSDFPPATLSSAFVNSDGLDQGQYVTPPFSQGKFIADNTPAACFPIQESMVNQWYNPSALNFSSMVSESVPGVGVPTQPLFPEANFDFSTISVLDPASILGPAPQYQAAQAVPAPVPAAAPIRGTIPCSIPWCTKTFRRKHEQVRHEASVHGINQGVHRCQVIGCPSYGRGFSRKDKLTEHKWRKHANLGFVKRVS
jgi:hypothetical protein